MTPNLPPLPLVDGCLLIDNSFLEGYTTCPRLTQHSRLENRVRSDEKPSLLFGQAGHLVWEHRYRKYGTDFVGQECENEQVAILEKFFVEHPVADDERRNLNWAVRLFVTKYNERYRVEPFNVLEDADGKVMVELSFALPLFRYTFINRDEMPDEIPILYCGRIDLPVLWDNQIIVIDHKTTGQLGRSFYDAKRVSAQQLGYCWAFQKLTKRPVAGFCINAVRTSSEPAKPVGGPGKWWEECYSRAVKEYIRQDQIDEWKHNAIALVEQFFWNYQQGFMPQYKESCCRYGRCAYYDVCDTPQQSRESLLTSTMFTKNTFTPLKPIELKKL